MPVRIQLVPFTPEYGAVFLQLAAVEGWITDSRELEFLTRSFPAGCLTALVNGEPAAFITAITYESSAWIGNLLVAHHERRRGTGRLLMTEVLQRLDAGGCATVWLTASAEGAGLYRSLGFEQIDIVRRWRTTGTVFLPHTLPADREQAALLDSAGWGDNRRRLFADRQDGAGWLHRPDGFLCSAPVGSGLQLGPWGADNGIAAAALLQTALQDSSGAGDIFLDVPGGNRTAGELLTGCGFTSCGSTLLMYRGRTPAYRPELIYSLASMGSYG